MKIGAKSGKAARDVTIRRATEGDLPAIVALDQATTGQSKPDYWRDMLTQFSGG